MSDSSQNRKRGRPSLSNPEKNSRNKKRNQENNIRRIRLSEKSFNILSKISNWNKDTSLSETISHLTPLFETILEFHDSCRSIDEAVSTFRNFLPLNGSRCERSNRRLWQKSLSQDLSDDNTPDSNTTEDCSFDTDLSVETNTGQKDGLPNIFRNIVHGSQSVIFVDSSQLDSLLRNENIGCLKCRKRTSFKLKYIAGFVCEFSIRCGCSNSIDWSTSSLIPGRKTYVMNVLISTAVLISGMTNASLKEFCICLGGPFPDRIWQCQKEWTCPAILEEYGSRQKKIFEFFNSREGIHISIDGAFDKTKNAEFSHVSFIEYQSVLCIHDEIVSTIDSPMEASINAEFEAFKKGLNYLLYFLPCKITEITVDGNTRIWAFLKKNHPEIKLHLDYWHAAKKVGRLFDSFFLDEKNLIKTDDSLDSDLRKKKLRSFQHQLDDKKSGLKNHFYKATHDSKTPEGFSNTMNCCISHWSGEHENCSEACLGVSSKGKLTMIEAKNVIKKVTDSLCVHAERYMGGYDTSYNESLNNCMLVRANKRITYKVTYPYRIMMGVIDWNENVSRRIKQLPPKGTRKNKRRRGNYNSVYTEDKKRSYNSILLHRSIFCASHAKKFE